MAAGAAAIAVLLAWPARVSWRSTSARRVGLRWWPALAAALAAALLSQVVHGTRLVVCLLAIGVSLGVYRLVLNGRRGAAAERVADLVLGVTEGMAADLQAGQTAEAALDRASADWAPLASAAMAARLGGDVPAALRDLARQPGAEAMRIVAAAWQVSHRSGAGLAGSLGQTVVGLRERRRTSRMVASELSSAKATAHVMALLPVGVLVLGNGVGGDPIGFLLDTPVGLGCLGLGATLALAGLFWLQHISDRVAGR